MASVIDGVVLNGETYSNSNQNKLLIDKLIHLENEVLKLKQLLKDLDLTVEVDGSMSLLSNNPISNATVTSKYDSLKNLIDTLENRFRTLNLADFATKDYVVLQVNERRWVVDNKVDKKSENPVSGIGIAKEFLNIRLEMADILKDTKNTYATKSNMLNSILLIDLSLSNTSGNPVTNAAISKEIASLKTSIDNITKFLGGTSGSLGFSFSNNLLLFGQTPILTFSQDGNQLTINVLGKKTYTIKAGSDASTASYMVYDSDTRSANLVTGAKGSSSYSAGNLTVY